MAADAMADIWVRRLLICGILTIGAMAGIVLWPPRSGDDERAPGGVAVVHARASDAPATVSAALPVVPAVPGAPAARPARAINDPLVDGLLDNEAGVPPGSSHSGLYHAVRKERRDQEWAPRAEAALLANIATVPYLDRNVLPRVICGSSLCEVVVTLSSGATIDQANRALDLLQSDDLVGERGAHAQLDADYHSAAVGSTERNRDGTVILRYIPRLRQMR